MPRVVLLLAILLAAVAHGGDRPALAPAVAGLTADAEEREARCPAREPGADVLTFHGDPRRLGWNASETELTPGRVASGAFGPAWSSSPLDAVTLGGRTYPPHLYATPLYAGGVRLAAGPHAGLRLDVVIAASSNAWVYAINANRTACDGTPITPGEIVWRARLGSPAILPGLDGGVPIGILSTPVVDRAADPARVYVTALDAGAGWQVFALALSSGRVLPGWPLAIDDRTLAPVTRNGPARFGPAIERAQRAALNLSPRGDLLYVAFGGTAPGFMVAVDTHGPRVLAAFAGAPATDGPANAGMWSPGGPAIGPDGRVYMTTGNSPALSAETPGVWGSSLLRWSPSLMLEATYTPPDYCVLDRGNMDLGGPLILPDFDPGVTATLRLITFGGKQGVVYLIDRDRLAGGVDRRPPCRLDTAADGSPRSSLTTRDALLVFGPPTTTHAQLDHARMRTTPAYYRDARGNAYLFVSGASKARPDSPTSVPPGLVKLRVVAERDTPASLRVERREITTTLVNPGSPVVSSHGANDALVWVLDPNQPRLAPLVGTAVARPVLYAFDAATLAPLWRSAPGNLEVGGKYGSPLVARGLVFVGTDRVQAFGLRWPAGQTSEAIPGSSSDQHGPHVLGREPPEKARDVLAEIEKRKGEPPPGYVGGRIFQNRERRLPRGRYREYDVNPRVQGQNRGPERILIEQRTGKAYYTPDHYETFVPLN